MECKKCKAKLNDGETFCRKCATSIYVDDVVPVYTNGGSIHKINNIKKVNDNKTVSSVSSAPTTIDLSNINNKDFINRGQNDESLVKNDIKKTLIIVFVTLFLLIALIALAVSFL
jgi:hypothetical protein